MSAYYLLFSGFCITVLKELNILVDEPYMVRIHVIFLDAPHEPDCWHLCILQDEPFHIPQAQAYCRGDFEVWDPKLTTPPGL